MVKEAGDIDWSIVLVRYVKNASISLSYHNETSRSFLQIPDKTGPKSGLSRRRFS